MSHPLPMCNDEWSHAITTNDDSEPTDDLDTMFEALSAISKEALMTVEVDDGRPVCWEDLLPIARQVLAVWVDGAELPWAEHAWAALTEAGLTRATTEVDRARVVCRLLALALMYREFCARAFEEGTPGEWSPDANDVLDEEEPYLHPFVLGQLAERDGIDADVEIGYVFEQGTPANALREITRDQYDTVVDALRDCWGRATLFASLWTSADSDTTYPLTSEVVGDVVNSDVSFSKLEVWQWVEEGMHLG